MTPNLDSKRAPTYSFSNMNGEAKLRELILYISERCDADTRFGAVKLNKILVFSDFLAYFRFGTPITGVAYMRQPRGPVPKRMKPILDEMAAEHVIAIKIVQVGRFQQKRVVPLRPADLDLFQASEIALVDEVIAAFWKRTAKDVSDFSHGVAWKAAGADGVAIPYEAAFVSDEPLNSYDEARTAELVREHGWND